MNSFQKDACWNGLDDYSTIDDFDVYDFYLTSPSATSGVSLASDNSAEKSMKKPREKKKGGSQPESKAYREKLRREKMSDRFSELCKFLHPGRPGHIDKCSILGDAISSLSKLKSELHELKERKKKIQHSIQNLKDEKNELREEKQQLQANKQKIELQIKATSVVPTGLIPVQNAAYQGRGNKGMVMSGYGGYPMWQWIPSAVLDTSQDHVLRPPVA